MLDAPVTADDICSNGTLKHTVRWIPPSFGNVTNGERARVGLRRVNEWMLYWFTDFLLLPSFMHSSVPIERSTVYQSCLKHNKVLNGGNHVEFTLFISLLLPVSLLMLSCARVGRGRIPGLYFKNYRHSCWKVRKSFYLMFLIGNLIQPREEV